MIDDPWIPINLHLILKYGGQFDFGGTEQPVGQCTSPIFGNKDVNFGTYGGTFVKEPDVLAFLSQYGDTSVGGAGSLTAVGVRLNLLRCGILSFTWPVFIPGLDAPTYIGFRVSNVYNKDDPNFGEQCGIFGTGFNPNLDYFTFKTRRDTGDGTFETIDRETRDLN